MSITNKFAHGDIVKVIATGEIGTVLQVRRDDPANFYQVQTAADEGVPVELQEEELVLVKLANDEETGFEMRYIT